MAFAIVRVAALLTDKVVSVPLDTGKIPVTISVRSEMIIKFDRIHSFKLISLPHTDKGTK